MAKHNYLFIYYYITIKYYKIYIFYKYINIITPTNNNNDK
jgi:hypothetical protein